MIILCLLNGYYLKYEVHAEIFSAQFLGTK